MSRPTRGRVSAAPATITAGAMEQVSGNRVTMAGSAAVYPNHAAQANVKTDHNQIVQAWQVEAYRQVNICGEARYAASLFAAVAGRAELGISEAQTKVSKVKWVPTGPEVDALAEIAPTVRERTKLIRDFMMHRIIAGECYLIARKRVDTDPGYIPPPNFTGTWDEYLRQQTSKVDLFNAPAGYKPPADPNTPIWEIVAVTEMQKVGTTWRVRHDNGNYLDLTDEDPVIRMWSPDPQNRREAWSPFRSMLSTLQEIEWLTRHIFTQVRSRLMSAGVWFLPDNLTFAPPPPDMVEGGAEAIAQMNDAERFMAALAASSMNLLASDEVSFPTVVMSDATALGAVDQNKLIKFWADIDDKAMVLRTDAIQRFALGMDLPPEQVLGAAAAAGRGGSGSGSSGQMNHWGQWALDEQTITSHIEPALDDFVGVLTTAFLRVVVEGTTKVIGYDTTSLRLRPDRSKEAMEWYDRGQMKASVAFRETGFDPDTDMMDDDEFKKWALVKILSGSWLPVQMQAALKMFGIVLDVPMEDLLGQPGDPNPGGSEPHGQPGQNQPPSLEDHPTPEGPPQGDHDHQPAPFGIREAAAEVLVLRALEKAGNVLLNNGKRGKDKDRTTPLHMAHVVNDVESVPDFDFTLASTVFGDLPAAQRAETERQLADLCASLYREGAPYTRTSLIQALGA